MVPVVLDVLIAHHTPDECGVCFSITKLMTVLFHKAESSFVIYDVEFCFCVCIIRNVHNDHQMIQVLFDRKWGRPIYLLSWHLCTK